MFNSRRAKLSNADSAAGQSLFDFLKRKKRVALQDSVRQSRRQQQDMSFSNIEVKQQNDFEPADTTRNQTYRKNATTNVTPKRVTFVQSEQKRKGGQTARTFIDMISPIKSKQSRVYDKDNVSLEQQRPESKQYSSKKKPVSQQFSRKQFNKSLQVMLETIKNLIHVGKSIKQKSHSLFIDMKPVFKIAQESTNKIIKKKVQQAKQKLRVMEHQFSQLDIENQNQIIENFHRTLSEHLLSVQSNNRSSYEKSQMDNLSKMRNEKDTKIIELSGQNKSLLQNINILQRKIQKLEAQLDKNKESNEQKFQNYHLNNEQKYIRMEDNFKQLQQQNKQLLEKLEGLKKQCQQKDKRLKDALYAKQTTERRLIQENEKAKSARQEFLLNQIMMIKKEFQNDISQLTALFSLKQKDHLSIIQEQKKQIKELKEFIEGNKQNEKKIGSDSQALKVIVNKYRKQNECLVTDMHRMNEELYQHWLALKDIKTLATRLHLLPRFVRIFEDLAFNDQLFS